MPRINHFACYPPFPDNVVVADLPRVSLTKLQQHDVDESARLFQACTEIGFFLLDLTGSSTGETMLDDAGNSFALSQEIFDLEQEELGKYPFIPKNGLHGYKTIGTMKLEDGSPDNVEVFGLMQDDMLGTTVPRPNPEVILSNRKTFEDIFHHAYDILCHLLRHIEIHLDLAPGTFASLCRQDRPSQSMLRMLKSPPGQIGSHRTNLIGHTDLGTITMLFNIVGGLQILPPGCENTDQNWVYVRPEPGCAIINLGDAMVQWSGGVLRSNIHRVATPPGQQAACERYSVAYFLRPEATASMRRLGGTGVIPPLGEGEEDSGLCALEWEKMRSAAIVAGDSLPKSMGGLRS